MTTTRTVIVPPIIHRPSGTGCHSPESELTAFITIILLILVLTAVWLRWRKDPDGLGALAMLCGFMAAMMTGLAILTLIACFIARLVLG